MSRRAPLGLTRAESARCRRAVEILFGTPYRKRARRRAKAPKRS